MSQQDIETRLDAHKEREKFYERKLLDRDYGSREEFADCVKGYVLAKYLLPAEEKEENLTRLAEKSVAQILKLPVETLKKVDKPGGCTVTTAVSDKKVLLLMRMGKMLQNRIKPDQVTEIRTIANLADYFYAER